MNNSNTPSKKECDDLINYCNYFSLPLEHVVESMYGLKVIPMIRGICFEFSVEDKLREVVSAEEWKVDKPSINAQAAIQDIDVLVTHIKTGKKIAIECKLTKKDSFQIKEGHAEVQVKCMRSRTVNSKRAAKALATRYGISEEEVLRHKDNYRVDDFECVVTSLGNAFWITDKNGMFVFTPSGTEIAYLRKFFNDEKLDVDSLKAKTFNYFLIAKSSSLVVSPNNNITCRRRSCIEAGTSDSCGFIPNNPVLRLEDFRVWKPIERAEEVFKSFLN